MISSAATPRPVARTASVAPQLSSLSLDATFSARLQSAMGRLLPATTASVGAGSYWCARDAVRPGVFPAPSKGESRLLGLSYGRCVGQHLRYATADLPTPSTPPLRRGPISTRTRSCKAPWQCADCLARTDAPALERPAASTAMEEDCVPVAGKRDNARLELAAPSRKRTRQASPETAGEQGNDGSTTKRAHKELSSKQGGAKGSSDGAGRGKGRGHVGKAACGLGAQQRGSGMGSCANEGNAAAATLPRARTRMRTRADDRTGSTEHVTTRDGAGPLTATATDDDCKVEDHTASPDAPSLPVASRRGVHDSSGGRVTMTKAPAAPTPRDASHASVQPRTAQEASLWRHVGLQLLVLPDMQPRPPKRSRGKTGTAHTDGGINLGFSDLDREHTATEHTATYGPGATEPTQTQPASTLLRPESPRERVHVLLFNLNALRGGVEPWEQCGGCGNYVALPRTTLR